MDELKERTPRWRAPDAASTVGTTAGCASRANAGPGWMSRASGEQLTKCVLERERVSERKKRGRPG
jgi:hypothetical protein